MTEHTFQYAVLRYAHDPVTQEYINVGIVIYSQQVEYLRSCMPSSFLYYWTSHIDLCIDKINRDGQFDQLASNIKELLATILPPDDSSLVFGLFGGGITDDLDSELLRLNERFVRKEIRGMRKA